MRRVFRITSLGTIFLAALAASHFGSAQSGRDELLKARESVWRAWFANDTKVLEQLVPSDTIVISSGEEKWKNQADILQSAAQFHSSGGKLLRLEFPRTEIQRFGDVAVLYSQYVYETEEAGRQSQTSGRVTEVFVRRNGVWTNPGWHTDTEK
jgi:ketosteroid isomerase-like protein